MESCKDSIRELHTARKVIRDHKARLKKPYYIEKQEEGPLDTIA